MQAPLATGFCGRRQGKTPTLPPKSESICTWLRRSRRWKRLAASYCGSSARLSWRQAYSRRNYLLLKTMTMTMTMMGAVGRALVGGRLSLCLNHLTFRLAAALTCQEDRVRTGSPPSMARRVPEWGWEGLVNKPRQTPANMEDPATSAVALSPRFNQTQLSTPISPDSMGWQVKQRPWPEMRRSIEIRVQCSV